MSRDDPNYDGGAAFPHNPEADYEGLSVRDYFAAAALSTFYAEREPADHTAQQVAERAYRMADAMLAARKGTP